MFFLLVLPLVSCRPEIWPPTGKLSPNNYIPPPLCTYKPTVVEVEEVEKTCVKEDKEVCETVLEEVIEEIVETNCEAVPPQTICSNVTIEQEEEKCEKVECDPNEYKNTTKHECSYETILSKKCWRSYEVTYQDVCTSKKKSQCSLPAKYDCESVEIVSCKKVPQLPKQHCQMVPRLKQKDSCKDFIVKRPVCVPEMICTNITVPLTKEECKTVNSDPKCEEIVTKVPKQEEKEKCTNQPQEVCTSDVVTRPRIVNKRVCQGVVGSGEELTEKLVVATLDNEEVENNNIDEDASV